eukprot:TRINITY_DN73534_c0_g1_i1.p1 TRINITY_DN73534_c0_g1~~TRINITY_DN73534_c0_g1_i1.p1  ORF type:complete len:394 (-),score=38.90 TRINITY_DN73534_c0_g1_i1:181-1362(-)
MVSTRTLWEAYGPHGGGAIGRECRVLLEGLKARPALNGNEVTLVKWDGITGRFVVLLDGESSDKVDREHIKVKPANLRALCQAATPSALAAWQNNFDSQLGPLPGEVAIAVAIFLNPRSIAVLSTAGRSLRSALWLGFDAHTLWQGMLDRCLGSLAAEIARIARPQVVGSSMYCCARGLRQLFRDSVEIARGGVHENATGFEVVACPVPRTLLNIGMGAQGSVRKAAGETMERAIAQLAKPLPALSSTLVPGGPLAKRVALTVTEPPASLVIDLQSSPQNQIKGILGFLTTIHDNLLKVVREAGFRSLAMPTLCTGGIGMPVHLVAVACVRSIHRDFLEHPADPMRIRIACFETNHMPAFNTIKTEILEHFYKPDEARSIIMSALCDWAEANV